MRKRRKRREEGIQEGGSDGETQAEKGTETDVSGWAWVVPGRGDVSRRQFWGSRCRNGASGQVNMDQGIWDKNEGMAV